MTGIRTSLRRTLIVIAATIAAAGCGGDERAVETTPRPTLPRTVAEDLAARSDAIADALDAGDVCTAAVRADELQAATIAAVNNGQVPEEFQEDLQARANELVNTVNCPPPPPTTTEEEGGEENRGRGRGNKKGQNEGDEGGESVITVPPPTEVIP